MFVRAPSHGRRGPGTALAVAAALLGGCASPGPPRAPSLQLPAPVNNLQATRRGWSVELEFSAPSRTSEGLPYKGGAMRVKVCRAVDAGACLPVASLGSVSLAPVGGGGQPQPIKLQDRMPDDLAAGPARLLTYRVELSNARGRTAGFGDAAYAAAGAEPGSVAGLVAEGSRQGVVVRWQPEAAGPGGRAAESEVVLRRVLVSGGARGSAKKPAVQEPRKRAGTASPKSDKERETAGVVWLSTSPAPDLLGGARDPLSNGPRTAGRANGVLDDGAEPDSVYRYAAERQRTVEMSGHTVVLHSQLSDPVEVRLLAEYPPPPPTDLVGTVFPLALASPGSDSGGLAVDLIWTPADDAGTVGYNVVREVLGGPGSSRVKLTSLPAQMPSFHDVLPAEIAKANQRVRLQYSVTAVDASGMESRPVVTTVETSGQ